MKHTQTPVLLLTGYLGSGKTTLLNRILTNERGIRFAVIVNDIGEVNIDASLIQKGGVVGQKDAGDLVALQNGCICCTLKMDLVQQLSEIISSGKFDYIVIEASGICEPAPIAQTISTMPNMGSEYTANGVPRLDCIVTVVDALRMKSEFGCGDNLKKEGITEDDIENLVIEQIEFCNIILLNKISEVAQECSISTKWLLPLHGSRLSKVMTKMITTMMTTIMKSMNITIITTMKKMTGMIIMTIMTATIIITTITTKVRPRNTEYRLSFITVALALILINSTISFRQNGLRT